MKFVSISSPSISLFRAICNCISCITPQLMCLRVSKSVNSQQSNAFSIDVADRSRIVCVMHAVV